MCNDFRENKVSSAIKDKISFSLPLAQTAFPTRMWRSSRPECLPDRICQRVILIRVKIPYFLHVSAALWDESATAGDLCCPVLKACRLSALSCDNVLSRAQRGRVTRAHVPLCWTWLLNGVWALHLASLSRSSCDRMPYTLRSGSWES